ncbi:hypothetical protein ASY01nite_09730 [Acetobacter syzygii]|nr:hypothetical protein ASY01nite_09730 [Acetobacter syzygii]
MRSSSLLPRPYLGPSGSWSAASLMVRPISAKTKPDLPGYLLQINLKQANGQRYTPPPENLNFLSPNQFG